ncbi:MAG: UDP-glucose/GDP-mannose dehydrogenase family protein [Alphaproteobacteria bacterium]|nr:MAG: UDP-glucose/GDP-mannose dehydrogenase family protein [Alphaproteobacteria bacterium]
MRVTVVGSGYVGLVSGACFSEFGHDVVCVDKDDAKIARLRKGEIPIYEPGLEDLVVRNMRAGRLRFTENLAAAVPSSDAVFIAVGTPSRPGDGHADLGAVYAAADAIADHLGGYTVVVTKSTVPVGTGSQIHKRMRARQPGRRFDVVSNPEFLREGAAIEDFMRPDRVVIGTLSEQARAVMRDLYRPLFFNETPVVFTTRESAELIKYASNAFLATKISFINEMAALCEKLGADVQDVAKGMGLDKRIGSQFLHAGPGYGGSCFPKDTLALIEMARDAGAPTTIVEAVVAVNDRRKAAMVDKIVSACGGSVAGKRIAVLGLTFKPNTDDVRESPALVIVPGLLAAGATVAAYDPEGMEQARALMPDIDYRQDAYATMEGADALVIITEWNQFRALDLARAARLMRSPVLVDLRNIYANGEPEQYGFTYVGVGRGTRKTAGAAKKPQLKLVGA